MPAHLIPARSKARPLGFLTASVGTAVLVLIAFASGGVEETPTSVTTPTSSAVSVLGVVLRPPSTHPVAPAASVVAIPTTEPGPASTGVRRAAPPPTAPPPTAPPGTLGPPVSVTAPGRTSPTTTEAPATTTTTTTVVPTTDTTEVTED